MVYDVLIFEIYINPIENDLCCYVFVFVMTMFL